MLLIVVPMLLIKQKMNKTIIRSLLVVFIIVIAVIFVDAQCPMCRMSAESNLANGGSEGRNLNTGILYLLALPYTLLMVFGYIWYKNKKVSQK